MTPLRTTVLMKTDIAGSTPSFRALLAADLQALQIEHREFVARHAAEQGGRVVKPTGDGFWLEFPSVTGAAKSAIAMQDALSVAQPTKSGDRLSIRIVIGLGDVAVLDGDVIGDVMALIVRIEDITPANETYITFAARLVLAPAEVQTALVEDFSLKGFDQPIPVYRIEQRHRTRVIPNAYILFSDLRGFTSFTAAEPVVVVEHVLNTLDALIAGVTHEFDGTVRYSVGDSYCLTFAVASRLIAAAERLSAAWELARREGKFDCAIDIVLHRGRICAFRSFVYGEGIMVAGRVHNASVEVRADRRGGVLVTSSVRDDLAGTPWQSRLQPVAVQQQDMRLSGLEICRLSDLTTPVVGR
jgi:class 3 adenylate cyclase